jgi:hypothetical protein
MADLKYNGIALIAQVLGEDFNVTSDTNLYTVPVGKEFTPFAVCISKSSGSMTTATVSFGQSGAKTDFLAAQTLTGLNAAGDAVWCRPPGHATVPVGIVTYTAGEVFVIDHVVAQGAAMTADVSVFGFLNDA